MLYGPAIWLAEKMHELPSPRLFWESAASLARTRVQCMQSLAPCSGMGCQWHRPFQMGTKTSQKIVTVAYTNGAAAMRVESDKPSNRQSWAGTCWVLCICWRTIVFCGRNIFSCILREFLHSPSWDNVQLMDNPLAGLRKPQREEKGFNLNSCLP